MPFRSTEVTREGQDGAVGLSPPLEVAKRSDSPPPSSWKNQSVPEYRREKSEASPCHKVAESSVYFPDQKPEESVTQTHSPGGMVVVEVEGVGTEVVVVVVVTQGSQGPDLEQGSTQHSPETGWMRKATIRI